MTDQRLVGFIPAAGGGGSMKPHTTFSPKCLMRVGSDTLLEHSIRHLATVGPEAIYVMAGAQWPMILRELRSLRREYSASMPRLQLLVVKENTSNTGGGLSLVKEVRNGSADVVAFFPDVFLTSQTAVRDLVALHQAKKAEKEAHVGCTIGSEFRPIAEGVLELDGDNVTGFVEKPNSLDGVHFNTAISVWTPDILQFVADPRDSLFRDVLPRALAAGRSLGCHREDSVGSWRHLQTPDQLLDVSRDVLREQVDELAAEILQHGEVDEIQCRILES